MANTITPTYTGYNRLVESFLSGEAHSLVIERMIAYGWSYQEAVYALNSWKKTAPQYR